jgi:hypothetical protein
MSHAAIFSLLCAGSLAACHPASFDGQGPQALQELSSHCERLKSMIDLPERAADLDSSCFVRRLSAQRTATEMSSFPQQGRFHP